MIYLLVFAAAVATSYGYVDWKDFRGGQVSLPTNNVKALQANWKLVEKDDVLKVAWYSQEDDPRFQIGYDDRLTCAGVRVAFLESDIDPDYIEAYKKNPMFEEGTCHGKKLFYSTILFTAEKVLKKGGRRMLPTDEFALGVYLKKDGKYEKLPRDGCELTYLPFVEQACQNSYGLVFSNFGSKSNCDSLAPFYVIYDTKDTGNLMGFGWLSFSKFSEADYRTTTFYKTVQEDKIKALFPNAPECLNTYAQKGLTAVEVWMSHEASQAATCPGGDWTDTHCESKTATRPGFH